jgi:hypothetical protein
VVVVIAACVVVAVVAALVRPRQPEPEYGGKSLSQWLELCSTYSDDSVAEVGEAASAVRHMGTNALPFLVSWISYSAPAWKLQAFNLCSRAHWQRGMDYVWKPVVRADHRAEMALSGFPILREEASPAIPDLVRVMHCWRTDPSRRAIQALHCLGTAGLPPLLAVVTNGAVNVRFRQQALISISRMNYLGTNASPAVPILIHCLDDPRLAENAAVALGRLTLDSEHAVPALVTCIDHYKPASKETFAAIDSLAMFRGEARAAVPVLVSITNNPTVALDPRGGSAVAYFVHALAALEQIAPEVFRQKGHEGGNH